MPQQFIIVLCGPSGAGKTSLARALLEVFPFLSFSVSATTRTLRTGEEDGVDYYFLAPDDFRARVDDGAFLEHEEVYDGLLYGTLKSEIHRIWGQGLIPLLDVDVKGAHNIRASDFCEGLFIFVHPGDVETLRNRLRARRTESEASLQRRLERAEMELAQSPNFEHVVHNNDFEQARSELIRLVEDYTGSSVPSSSQ